MWNFLDEFFPKNRIVRILHIVSIYHWMLGTLLYVGVDGLQGMGTFCWFVSCVTSLLAVVILVLDKEKQ